MGKRLWSAAALLCVLLLAANANAAHMSASLGFFPTSGYTLSGNALLDSRFDGILETEAVFGYWREFGYHDRRYESVSPTSLDDGSAPVEPPIGPGYHRVYNRHWQDLFAGVRLSAGELWPLFPNWFRFGSGLTYHYAWPLEAYSFSDGVGQMRLLLFGQAKLPAGGTDYLLLELEGMLRFANDKDIWFDYSPGLLNSRDFEEPIVMLKLGYLFNI